MSDIVFSVEGLYKRYRLGTVDRQAFREDLVEMWAKWLGKPSPYDTYITANELAAVKSAAEIKSRYVWALQDINFEIKRGEVIGIIGKNGSGKSTLLKILSKTTSPTKGQVKIKGRIASLLEVGTGFHPELTGRQNVYLNGAILGMRKEEINRKFDEIIAFAGIEAFIDTPVKRYSSGMYVRLAFAVAAHLESDILIIDEVLAVGDLDFQKKCLGKMNDVSKNEGRTVLFVSHAMQTVKSLCTKGILLRNGTKIDEGETSQVINRYLMQDSDMSKTGVIPDSVDRSTNEREAKFRKIVMLDKDGEVTRKIFHKQKIRLLLTIKVFKMIKSATFGLYIITQDYQHIGMSLSRENFKEADLLLEEGVHHVDIELENTLLPGHYSFNIACFHFPSGADIDFVERVYDFEVLSLAEANDGHFSFTKYGSVYLQTKYSIDKI